MAAISIAAVMNPAIGKLQGSYFTVKDGVNFTGALGHGSLLTITDSLARFGTRVNTKPLWVSMSDGLTLSPLGRIAGSYFNTNSVVDTVVRNGSMASSLRLDFRQFGSAGIVSQPFILQDTTKPFIHYIERHYGFDLTSPRIQNNTYFFGQWSYANTRSQTFVIDGRTYSRTNDGTSASINNGAVIISELTALINGDALCKCTAGVNGDGVFLLTKKTLSDVFDVTITNTGLGEITQNFNNKCSRIYSMNSSENNDAYLTTIASGVGGAHTNTENTDDIGTGLPISTSLPYYNAKQEASAWMCEELVFKNSSINQSDGFYNHYKNGELLNAGNSMCTWVTGRQPCGRLFLNQMSNGPYGYWQNELMIRTGYQCADDEYNGIYFADSATPVPGVTKMVRQPQTYWGVDRVIISQVGSHVAVAGAYVHVRTGLSTYIYLGRLPV